MTAVQGDKCSISLFHFSADWPSYQRAHKLISHADKEATAVAHIPNFSSFLYNLFFFFSFLIPLRGAVPSLSVQPGFARGAPHDQSLFGQKNSHCHFQQK